MPPDIICPNCGKRDSEHVPCGSFAEALKASSKGYVKRWTPDFDLSTIPDAALRSEYCRRNALKRRSYTGGVFWKKHNPDTSRCRCARCMKKRAKERAAS